MSQVKAAENIKRPVKVILWFDTEDYLLPASDDAALRLANLLTERKIKATFKVVGEKARTLQRRGRTDVIEALKRHDIAYHSNFHSKHPTPSEYLAEAGFLDGIEEFMRREGPGAADVRKIFGVETLSCYGQPGSSWAAQTIAALKGIGIAPHGIPCYVDEGSHIGVNEQPFWYCNALVVYKMGQNVTRVDLHDPGALEAGKAKVSGIVSNLEARNGGLVSIYYHPCEWVHQEFWDGVNFARGANPAPEQWKAPRQISAEKTEAAFKQFEAYIDHIRSISNIKFVTASDLPLIYPNNIAPLDDGITVKKIAAHIVAEASRGKLDFMADENVSFSLADQFSLLVRALNGTNEAARIQFPLFGPVSLPVDGKQALYEKAQFDATVRDVIAFMDFSERVPSQVFLGAEAVAPAQFLVACAEVYQSRLKNETDANKVAIRPSPQLAPEERVAKDSPGLFGGWIIHKENFQAPKILEVARLQSWTLKPAIMKKE